MNLAKKQTSTSKLNKMIFPRYTIRTFKDFGNALIEEYRSNAKKHGFFNDGGYPTIFRIERMGNAYMLFHVDGVYALTKAAFLCFVRRAIKATVPVRLDI